MSYWKGCGKQGKNLFAAAFYFPDKIYRGRGIITGILRRGAEKAQGYEV